MSASHWSNDELLEHLYGLKSEDEHFRCCGECAARAREIADMRAQSAQAPDVPHEVLEAQRRNIYQRLGSPIRAWHPLRWAMTAAAVAAIILGLTLFHPGETPRTRASDDQFYAELSSLAQTPAPRAVQPIEALVDDDSQE